MNRKRNYGFSSTYVSAHVAAVFILLTTAATAFPQGRRQVLHNPTSGDPVSKILLLRIVRSEDERRWNGDLRGLFSARNAAVRSRAALAAGRIGNEDAVPDLVKLLERDDEPAVRAMAAFALGEIESEKSADALLQILKSSRDSSLRARAVEALGKIAAGLPKEREARTRELGGAILEALTLEAHRRGTPDRLMVLLALTATLRAKPANAGPVVAEFLSYSDARVREDAGNVLARLKLKDGSDQLRRLLTSDPDPIVRANAARVLGATEDKSSFDGLLDRALRDVDSRVRVSAIRALGLLKDVRAVRPLFERAQNLSARNRGVGTGAANEVLELATTLGRLRQGSPDSQVLDWLATTRESFGQNALELEIAFARISPVAYLATFGRGNEAKTNVQRTILLNWRAASSTAQGLGEIAALPDTAKDKKELSNQAEQLLAAMLDYRNSGLTINTLVAVHSEYAIPDVLRAYAAFKPKDLAPVLRKHLTDSDVIVRATGAELLAELPLDTTNIEALRDALVIALKDKDLNDAALSIIDALAKQKDRQANQAIKPALDSPDYLVRRRAVAALKATGAGDFSDLIGLVQTRNGDADYERALARIGKRVTATISTTRGPFTVELLPEDATLTVDNFIQLAKRNYFNGITVHRVVPNFVIQDGDPRGDGNGGPGYQIRCEINQVPYDRGAVGMALSGKDTGGSQWFVTHSPQPHLDGGYTVFGRVISGMNVVDSIARGDLIRSISVDENATRVSPRRE
jgi:cyclophilin family peptidyl-prolyl cis-trans isomerase